MCDWWRITGARQKSLIAYMLQTDKQTVNKMCTVPKKNYLTLVIQVPEPSTDMSTKQAMFNIAGFACTHGDRYKWFYTDTSSPLCLGSISTLEIQVTRARRSSYANWFYRFIPFLQL
jgi:hypothetical protein